jgi:hypothetical protein
MGGPTASDITGSSWARKRLEAQAIRPVSRGAAARPRVGDAAGATEIDGFSFGSANGSRRDACRPLNRRTPASTGAPAIPRNEGLDFIPGLAAARDESRQRSRSRRRHDRSAGIATASPSTRLLAQRSAANSMALAHGAVRADPANEGPLPPWTKRSSLEPAAAGRCQACSLSSGPAASSPPTAACAAPGEAAAGPQAAARRPPGGCVIGPTRVPRSFATPGELRAKPEALLP